MLKIRRLFFETLGYQVEPEIRFLFLRLLGLNYFFSYANLTYQWKGLWGSQGLLPIQEIVHSAMAKDGLYGFFKMPSIFWLSSSEYAIASVIGLGILGGLALILGFRSKWILVCLWIGYLSFSTVTNSFLIHMWDRLLLEAGFLAIFLCFPSSFVSGLAAVCLKFLWFRHLFVNGIEKFYGFPDPKWESLTFMATYWAIQPYPNLFAWWLEKLPLFIHKILTYCTFVAEMIAPWLGFGPRRYRILAFVIAIGLQVSIFLTGNYGVFNLLSISLSLLLLDKSLIPSKMLKYLRPIEVKANFCFKTMKCFSWIFGTVLLIQLGAQGLYFFNGFQKQGINFDNRWVFDEPQGIKLGNVTESWRYSPVSQSGILPIHILQIYSRFWLANAYGIYGTISETRNLISIEISNDGKSWAPLHFLKNNGPDSEFPVFFPFFRPHLDSHLWLESLGLQFPLVLVNHNYFSGRQNWPLGEFIRKIFLNSSDVQSLLATSLNLSKGPQYLRVAFFQCRFSTVSEWRESRRRWNCLRTNEDVTYKKSEFLRASVITGPTKPF